MTLKWEKVTYRRLNESSALERKICFCSLSDFNLCWFFFTFIYIYIYIYTHTCMYMNLSAHTLSPYYTPTNRISKKKKKWKIKQNKKQLTHILSNKNMTDFAILHHFALLSHWENVGYTLALIPSLLRTTKMLQESSSLLSALRQRKLEI